MPEAPLHPRCARWAASVVALAALGLAASVAVGPADAAPDSAYSTIAWETGCTVIDQPGPDEPGGWADLRCQPVFRASAGVRQSDSDARMSVWYGQGGKGATRAWASFTAFNEVNDTIEWRGIITVRTARARIAAIHRWFVDDGLGRPAGDGRCWSSARLPWHAGRDSCPVGYVDANANGNANAAGPTGGGPVWRATFAAASDTGRSITAPPQRRHATPGPVSPF